MGFSEVSRWKCTTCGNLYRDDDRAYECCPAVKEIDAYQCGNCGEVYEIDYDASNCCESREDRMVAIGDMRMESRRDGY